MVGQTVGKYRVLSRLGRGGMGTVYKAVDETLDREVAIKCLNHDLSETDVLKRFRAEAIALARLNHPNIATLFELTEHDGELLMVMEFVRGETFEKVSDRLGAMGVSRAVDLCTRVLDALSHAHRAGIVHRDLKPANLMLSESGIVKVMDFGLARMAGTEHLTNDGYMVGTPAYMSPEQVLGGEVDGRADLYAMGVVLFRLLTGQLPFKAESGIAMVQKQMYDQPTPVRLLRVELPLMCEELFARALAKSPDARYQTADEFKAALAVLNNEASSDITRTMAAPSPPAPILVDSSMEPTTRTPSGNVRPPSAATPRSGEVAAVALSAAVPPSAMMPPSAAVPAPVVVPSSAAVPTPVVAATPRKPPYAALAAGVLLLAAVPATFLWRGGETPPAATSSVSATPAAPSPAPSTAASAAPVAAAITPASTSAPPAAPVAESPKPPSPKPAATPVVSKAAPATPSSATKPAPAVARASNAPSGANTVAPASRAAASIVVFEKMKYLSVQEGKPRDRDASLRLAGDGLHVIDGGATIQSAAYSDVIAVFHSHAKEPKWSGPDGTALPVAKVGGKFGFLKGTPDWITVRTRTGFIPLRVDDNDLQRVIAELEARTGTKVVRTK